MKVIVKLLVADTVLYKLFFSDSLIEGSRTKRLLEREKSIEEELNHVS